MRARRRLEPTFLHAPKYVETFGPEVADIATLAGLPPDPEQEQILDLTFGILANGRSAAFAIDIIGPRQVMGKTGTIKMIELGWLYVTGEPLVVHTAHELDTTGETFGELRNMIEDCPALSRHLDPEFGNSDTPGVMLGNGRWTLQLNSEPMGRRRIRFKARHKTGGRGLAANKVVLDEMFATTPAMMGSLLPTLGAMPDPQVVTASSACLLDSVVLREKRDTGRKGLDPRQAYVEFCDQPEKGGGCRDRDCDHHKTRQGCVYDDEARWWRFMPALANGRADVSTIRALRQNMPAAEFGRELMVHHEDPPNDGAGGVLNAKGWRRLLETAVEQPDQACVVLDIAPNRRKASIGVAGPVWDSRGRDRDLVMVHTAPGLEWVVPKLVAMRARTDQEILKVGLYPAGQAQLLVPALTAAGIEFVPLSTADAGRATAGFIEAVNLPPDVELDAYDEPPLAHLGQRELDDAVRNVTTRFIGEAEVWERRDRAIDITALVAAAGALDLWRMQESDDYDVLDSVG